MADESDCIKYKISPRTTFSMPNITKKIVQPIDSFESFGNVQSNLFSSYETEFDIKLINDGYCYILTKLDSIIGYDEFLIRIDMRYTPDSCAYKKILKHEEGHVQIYSEIINEYKHELQNAIHSAADSIMPIFVDKSVEIKKMKEVVSDALYEKIKKHPDIVLVMNKIKSAEEIRNKKFDEQDRYDISDLDKCP